MGSRGKKIFGLGLGFGSVATIELPFRPAELSAQRFLSLGTGAFRLFGGKEMDCGNETDMMVASGHTAPNTPDLFRTPKLTVAGPGQY